MPPRKPNTQPQFSVQVNLVFTVHAKDKLDALNKTIFQVEDMKIPGCVAREVKWQAVKEVEGGG